MHCLYFYLKLRIFFFCSQAGRTDRKEYVRKRSKLNPFASTSNKEKKRKKNFLMMKHSQNVRSKGKRSFRDKQVSPAAVFTSLIPLDVINMCTLNLPLNFSLCVVFAVFLFNSNFLFLFLLRLH